MMRDGPKCQTRMPAEWEVRDISGHAGIDGDLSTAKFVSASPARVTRCDPGVFGLYLPGQFMFVPK